MKLAEMLLHVVTLIGKKTGEALGAVLLLRYRSDGEKGDLVNKETQWGAGRKLVVAATPRSRGDAGKQGTLAQEPRNGINRRWMDEFKNLRRQSLVRNR